MYALPSILSPAHMASDKVPQCKQASLRAPREISGRIKTAGWTLPVSIASYSLNNSAAEIFYSHKNIQTF